MDTLSSFVNDIASFQLNLPLWLQSGIILVIILSLVVGGYFLKDSFDLPVIQSGYTWFIAIAVINLLTILLIFTFYGKKTGTYIGSSGIRGKKGKRGKVGTSVSCSYECNRNIYIQGVRRTDIICRIDTYNSNFQTIYNAYNYFQTILNEGNSIDYTGMINHIILGKVIFTDTKSLNQTAIGYFRRLMQANSITWYLIKIVNSVITTSSDNTYGTFRSVVPKVGYLSIGDSVYGGNEERISLNSFVVSGDIMYPDGYEKLTTLQAYNAKTGDMDSFTIWRPKSQTTTMKAFDGSNEKHAYLPLGDVCSFGTTQPKIDDFAMIKDTCLDPVPINDLKLVFIYVGDLQFNNANNVSQYTQADSYLIENREINDIEIFSVWRTPMNTFICNFNTENELTNDTIYSNIINNLEDALNEYGNISATYKDWIVNRLTSIKLPSILIAMIYTRYFQLESNKELIYYVNKYQNQVPEFRNKTIEFMSTGALMMLINNTNNEYNKFNKNLMKQASISLRATKPLVYDPKKEKRLPQKILDLYNQVRESLDTIPVKVENSSSLLDVINVIIPNGLEGRIAVNSDGIAQGGILLNEIQETVLRLCKIIMPPTAKAYTIKDECLGTFSIDKEKRDAVKQLTDELQKYNKYLDIFATTPSKYSSQQEIIHVYEISLDYKIGVLCGHIQNYREKIQNMDMEEITTNRVNGLIKIYQEANSYLVDIIKNTP
jgi:hypothetical protein